MKVRNVGFIVKEIENNFIQIGEATITLDQNLKAADRLSQSILKSAFEGKLVPQDTNDEPASVLLERINAEKANNAGAANLLAFSQDGP